MTQRFLVMGDNHGDAGSLRRVLAAIEDDPIDAAIHIGDFTTAWRTSRQHDDERLGKERGVEQLREVEPVLEAIDTHASHGLLWVWGNQDYFGDLDYDLDVGTEIPDDGYVEAAGQRFTSSPDRVESDAVLVTHVEKWSLLDHFEGRAHFCGNTHCGRHLGRRLNTAFLKLTDPEMETTTYGDYVVVDFGDDSINVELRSIGDLERKACDRHGERGVQFRPADEDCMHCTDERILFREMAATAFYGLTGDGFGAASAAGGYHGTHVGGIVGASDNGAGVIGTVPATELVDCRVFSPSSLASFGDILAAVVYSAEIGADAANLSLGAYPIPR